jgi:hypothetical protein
MTRGRPLAPGLKAVCEPALGYRQFPSALDKVAQPVGNVVEAFTWHIEIRLRWTDSSPWP